MNLKDLINLLGPFAEAAAQSMVGQTAPEVESFGYDLGKKISDTLHKSKTDADDVLVEGNIKALATGLVAGLDAPFEAPVEPTA